MSNLLSPEESLRLGVSNSLIYYPSQAEIDADIEKHKNDPPKLCHYMITGENKNGKVKIVDWGLVQYGVGK